MPPMGERLGDGAAIDSPAASPPPLYRAPEVAGRTVRQIVYPAIDGHHVRLRLSNAYGTRRW